MNELRSLLPYFRRHRRGMVVGLVLVVVANLFGLAIPYLLKVAVDAMEQRLDLALLSRYAGLVVLAAAGGGVARYFQRELLNGLSRKIERDLRGDLFGHLLRMPVEFFDRWRTGDLMSRATNDVLAVRQVAGPAIMYLVNTATVSALALGFMVYIDPMLTLLAMVPMAILPWAVYLFGQKIHARFQRIQHQFSELSNFVQENLNGIRIVKAYTREGSQARRFATMNREYLNRNMDLAKVWGGFHPSLTLLTGLAAAVVLWFGGGQVVEGRITVGDFVAFTFYLTLLSWPMIALGWVTNLFQRGAASMGRINELLRTPPAIASPVRPRPIGEPAGSLTFESVSFRYPGTERWVLRDVSFRIEPGRTVAVVGATGAGKTTLVRLVPRLYDPTEGSVRLDGVDVRELSLGDLRTTVSMVPQDPFLFSIRLRRNIALPRPEEGRPGWSGARSDGARRDGTGSDGTGRSGGEAGTEGRTSGRDDGTGAEERRLLRALEIAQLTGTLRELPGGLDTPIGERGVNLSGGQKQRATLARALFRDTPLLILDDALSAVDTVTETAILQGLRGWMRHRTTILVSHRVSAVREADHILMLEEGRLVEQGTHDELMARAGPYARLLERQLLAEELERIDAASSLAGEPAEG